MIALVILGLALLLVVFRPRPSSDLRQISPTRVEATIVAVSDVKPMRRFTGRVEPSYRSILRFEVSGRVSQVLADSGAEVKAGESLIHIEDADYQDKLTEARALLTQEEQAIASDKEQLMIATESLALAQKEVDRLMQMGKALASETLLDSAKRTQIQLQREVIQLQQAVTNAEQRLAVRQVAVNRAERDLDRTRLRAPFDAQVSERFVSPGDYVTNARDALQIISLDAPELLLHVPGTIAQALTLQQPVQLHADDKTFSGQLLAIQPDASGQTATHQVRVGIVTTTSLVPGQLMQVDLPLPALSDALVVPLSAVLSDDGEHVVFVIQADKVERRRVRLGLREGNMQIVLDGVSAGEQIVRRDLAALVDGQQVLVISE